LVERKEGMKTFIDRLRDKSLKELEDMVMKQKCEIGIAKRDLRTMEGVLAEKERRNEGS